MIKFNKHNVINTETKVKARVHYSLDNRVDGRKCVTLYAKDYKNNLDTLFADSFEDNTEMLTYNV
jgi:hypothetical protein